MIMIDALVALILSCFSLGFFVMAMTVKEDGKLSYPVRLLGTFFYGAACGICLGLVFNILGLW